MGTISLLAHHHRYIEELTQIQEDSAHFMEEMQKVDKTFWNAYMLITTIYLTMSLQDEVDDWQVPGAGKRYVIQADINEDGVYSLKRRQAQHGGKLLLRHRDS